MSSFFRHRTNSLISFFGRNCIYSGPCTSTPFWFAVYSVFNDAQQRRKRNHHNNNNNTHTNKQMHSIVRVWVCVCECGFWIYVEKLCFINLFLVNLCVYITSFISIVSCSLQISEATKQLNAYNTVQCAFFNVNCRKIETHSKRYILIFSVQFHGFAFPYDDITLPAAVFSINGIFFDL